VSRFHREVRHECGSYYRRAVGQGDAEAGAGVGNGARADGDSDESGPSFHTYLAQVDQLITTMTASALESGIAHSQAVTLAIETFKQVEAIARDESMELLPEHELAKVYTFCCAVLASGTTFSPFEIAQRAVLAVEVAREELGRLFATWDPVDVEERVKRASWLSRTKTRRTSNVG
jgi:hypothetical protein